MAGGSEAASVTRWLARARDGDAQAMGHAYAVVYDDLKRAAHQQLRRGGGTYNTTALVNETYLKLSADSAFDPNDRRHLLALSARAMRQVLVDHARYVNADKRDGGACVTLSTDLASSERAVVEVLALDRMLETLSQADERAARGVELRYFGGYSETEIADMLGVTLRTVQRDWRKARAFLLSELEA
jgi:RNA polymerase sigma factor (TIGR02999 family)